MNIVFSKHNARYKKARFGRFWIKSRTVSILKGFMFLNLLIAATLVFLDGPLYSATFIPVILIFMFLQWIKGDIIESHPTLTTSTLERLVLNDALEASILGRLKDPSTPQGIWLAVRGTRRNLFFLFRYGLDVNFFDAHILDNQKDGPVVWQRAYDLARQQGEDRITAATLTVALLTTIPEYETFLAEAKIEYQDLLNGLQWQRHIEEVHKKLTERNSFGGVARDWTAGYTPLLSQMGVNLTDQIQSGGQTTLRDTHTHLKTVDQMVRALSQSATVNVGLVGKIGVGKSTTVQAFSQYLLTNKSLPDNLKYHQVFKLEATTLLSNVGPNGNIEALITKLFSEASHAGNIIIYLGDAQLFFKQETGAVDLSNVLLPILEKGGLRLILSMSPNDWQKIKQNKPQLANIVNQINIEEPEREEAIQVMQDQLLLIEFRQHKTFMYQAIQEAYRLGKHYIQDGAFPGKGVRLLEAAARNSNERFVTDRDVQEAVETMIGVKVQKAGKEEKQKLLNLEDEIHKSMINQTRAVKVVSDALRRSRSGVGNPEKPIGTFLFMGPTGVGKTELSKAVASSFFGGKENMIRIDMNEFGAAGSEQRLLGDVNDSSEGLLPQIRKQPFSVVLFDEIEKANPKVLDLFLQMLDEGIMKDINNKEASFRDAVIIATSNAAASEIQRLIADGHDLAEIENTFVKNLINSDYFKPEFLNRFDEIVLFRPLTKDELLQVVDLIMANINRTLARQKVSVELTQAAKQWIVENGYDERLGARPIRRVAQRTVENIVAKRLLEDSFKPGSQMQLDAADLEAASG